MKEFKLLNRTIYITKTKGKKIFWNFHSNDGFDIGINIIPGCFGIALSFSK